MFSGPTTIDICAAVRPPAAVSAWLDTTVTAVSGLARVSLRHGDENDMTIDIGGQLSTMPGRRLFPAERARAGARAFFATGERPTGIPWQPEQRPRPRGS